MRHVEDEFVRLAQQERPTLIAIPFAVGGDHLLARDALGKAAHPWHDLHEDLSYAVDRQWTERPVQVLREPRLCTEENDW